MSIRVMAQVWGDSQQSGGKLLVLLALADYANDEGVCWPSIESLAAKARLSERQTQRVIRELESSGEVKIYTGGFVSGDKLANTYRVQPRQNVTPPAGPEMSPMGDTGDAQRVTPTTPQPSTEPSEEPSTAEGTSGNDAAAPGDEGHLPGLAPDPAPVDEAVDDDPRAAEVWTHYVGVFGDRLRIKELTAPRARSLKKALRAVEGNVEICKLAIDGLRTYRMEHPDGSQDVSLGVVFETGPHSRSSLTDQIEWWADQCETSASIDPSVPSVLRDRVTRRRVQVVEMVSQPGVAGAKERGEEALEWLRAQAKEEPVIEDGKVVSWRKLP
jgi:hypothetical protein